MNNFRILNTREIKRLIENIKEQYSIDELRLDYIFLVNNKEKIFILSKDFKDLNIENLRINSIGLYFAKIEKDGIRLSIDGTQLIGDKAKNAVEVNKKEMEQWIRGNDIEMKKNISNYVILKYNNDYLGCGKYKEGKILNFVDKGRRIKNNGFFGGCSTGN